ncbi:MAG: DUF523 domain-containing protein [Gammaproteobacteria bacterium]|nr:DUF523 domain-containing protein [Gammaproteobacteria bacterium]
MQANTDTPQPNIQVAVSSCLLGHKVRYDGKHKKHLNLINSICQTFTCLPLCPEQAIGLGVPRQAIQLVILSAKTRAIGVNTPELDVTNRLKAYAAGVADTLFHISGYIFKAKSPSCGLIDVSCIPGQARFDGEIPDEQISVSTFVNGIFSGEIQKHMPELPVVDETQLSNQQQIQAFIRRVKSYATSNNRY